MAYHFLRYNILFVILCFVYGNDEENKQEIIQKEAGTDHENDKHIIGDYYLNDEFWDQLLPITDLPTFDGVEFVGNHLKYTDQKEYDTQNDDNESIGKNEDDKNSKLKRQTVQLKPLNEIYKSETFEINKKKEKGSLKRPKISEVWEHFKKNGNSKTCNYCDKEIKTFFNNSSTSNFWRHLYRIHRHQYDSTEYAKTKKEHENKKVEAKKEKEDTAISN